MQKFSSFGQKKKKQTKIRHRMVMLEDLQLLMDLNISSIQSFHVMAEISLDFLQSAICSLQSANIRH